MQTKIRCSQITRRIIFLFLLCSVLLSLFAVPAEASTVASGTCGDNLTWMLDDAGTMTIDGTGDMYDYPNISGLPWYSQKTLIKSVNIKTGVTSIGEGAFYDCSNLKSVTISNSVTSIGIGAFLNCSSLTSVMIPNNVTNIGMGAFMQCFRLTSVIIPNSVTIIEDAAFWGCCFLTDFIVDHNNPNYSSVDGVLFNKDKTLLICYPMGRTKASYRIPNTVTDIGAYSFYCPDYLENLFIPKTVTSIGEYAFSDCDSLRNVMYSGTEDQWQEIEINEGNECLHSADITYSTIIHQGVYGNQHWEIDNTGLLNISGSGKMMDFDSNEKTAWNKYADIIESVIIEPGITSIGEWSFQYCSNVVDIYIPDTVAHINKYAFYYCFELSTVFYSGTLTQAKEIDIRGMNGYLLSVDWICSDTNSKLSSLTYEGLTENGMIWHYADKQLIISGEGAMIDKPWSFLNESISDIIIMQGITSIANEAFYNCINLTSINIPTSVISIGRDAFAFCESLENLIIPDGVTSIGESAFEECSNLQSITLPENLKNIGDCAFNHCYMLQSVSFPGNIPVQYDYHDYFGEILAVALPSTIKTIGVDIFNEAPVGSTVKPDLVLPWNLSVIEEEAFCGNNATFIHIPSNVTYIGHHAFADCKNLTLVLFEMPWRDHITIENDAFDNTECILIFEQDDDDLNAYVEQHDFKVIRYDCGNG